MRSKISKKILNETPPEVRENVRLRERISVILRTCGDNKDRAASEIMDIIKPLQDRIESLKFLLEVERGNRKDCPF
jgi:hypothetical protein